MRRFLAIVLLLQWTLLLHTPAQAQAAHPYTPQELEALVAPVALYPDPVVLNVLEAARYPAQVTEAARDPQNPAAEWHPSVRFLLAFPELIARMAESPQWMLDLGSASIGQWQALMSAVQLMRQRAYQSGSLRSDERQHVVQEGPWILVRPVQPQLWRPAHRPVHWHPWPAHGPALMHRSVPASNPYLNRVRPAHSTQPSTTVARPGPAVTPYVNTPESRRQPIVHGHTPHQVRPHSNHPPKHHHPSGERDNPSRAYKRPG